MGLLTGLQQLNLNRCPALEALPSALGELTGLQRLNAGFRPGDTKFWSWAPCAVSASVAHTGSVPALHRVLGGIGHVARGGACVEWRGGRTRGEVRGGGIAEQKMYATETSETRCPKRVWQSIENKFAVPRVHTNQPVLFIPAATQLPQLFSPSLLPFQTSPHALRPSRRREAGL
eukprot:2564423-Rhodomonas_salina.1